MKKYIIIPGCSDLNRGDQALAWETKRIAEDCGFIGEYYLTTERDEPVNQSLEHGLKVVLPILEHPSRKFKTKENIRYTRMLKIKWGLVSVVDLLGSLFILWKPTRHIVKKFVRKEKVESIEAIEQADAIFMKGGGLLQTYGGLSSTYSMYFWVYPILLANVLDKPVYVMPNSLGPFEGPLVKNIVRTALRKSKVLTTRETMSCDMVKKQLGLTAKNFPDLAFYLPKSKLDRKAIYEKYNLPYDKKLVAMTMRPYRFPGSDDPEKALQTFKQEMADFISWLFDSGYMPVIVDHTRALNAHENDAACIRDVTALIPNEKYRIISDETYNCYDLKCIYSFCDYIVGTRFHSVIFSFGCGVPGIAISYTGNKSVGIMHDIGLDDYVVAIGDVRAEILKRKFTMLVGNEESIKDKITDYLTKADDERSRLIAECKACS